MTKRLFSTLFSILISSLDKNFCSQVRLRRGQCQFIFMILTILFYFLIKNLKFTSRLKFDSQNIQIKTYLQEIALGCQYYT